jgi:DNA-binding FrmR family transcriptional regulator
LRSLSQRWPSSWGVAAIRSSASRLFWVNTKMSRRLTGYPVGVSLVFARNTIAHTTRDKTKLLHRVRRIRGQLNAIEKALLSEHECSTILLTVAACRGAMDSLMAEIIGDHIQFHILDSEHKPTAEQKKAAKEIISVVRRYFK